MPSTDSRAPGRWAIFGGTGLALALSLGLAPAYADPLDAYGYGLRVTARTSFALFMLAYLARPLTEVFGVGRWLVRHRRYLGLGAAFAHTVHFGYVALYVSAERTQTDALTLLFGGAAFVGLWLMAATSNDYSVRRLGSRWIQLHRAGLHYVWFVFTYTFIGVALFEPWYWSFVMIALAALALRVYAHGRRKTRTRRLGASV